MEISEALDVFGEEAKKQGADAWELVAGQSESTSLSVFEAQVKNTEISRSRGMGIRLFKNGSPGYAYTERLSRDALRQTVRDALDHAKLTDPLRVDLPAAVADEGSDLGLWNEKLENLELSTLKELSLELESLALQGDTEVKNVPYLGSGLSKSYSWFRNSRGHSFQRRANSVSAGLGVLSERDGVSKMGICSRDRQEFSELDAKQMASRAVERSTELLGAKSIGGGSYPVLFSNRVSGQILSMFSSIFFAEVVQKGQSRLEGRLGEKIAADFLNLCSDPTLYGLPGSRRFDGEGLLAKKLQVIENGRLTEFLYNLESAAREGRKASGSASRGYSGKVGTSFANFIISPGVASKNELISMHPQCFEVVKLEGGSGCSSVSGQISIGAQGFLWEGGKRVQAVDGVTLSTDFFELLLGIQAMGSEFNDSLSSVRVPDFIVDNVSISS